MACSCSRDESTDASGTVTVDVALPDNLTRYRAMAVAVSGDDHFGKGEAAITARLPLMVRPSAPRFLNFGDQFELPIVVQNQTDKAVDVDVAIEFANLTPGEAPGRRVTVPANDRVEVRFNTTTNEVGTARFRVAAVSGDAGDSAEVALPVYTPATAEAFATYGVLDVGAFAQPIAAPTDVFPQFGGLEVDTSSTAVHALTDAVLYLTDYRYENADGYATRILAVASLQDVLDAFDADGLPDKATLQTKVQHDIAELVKLQGEDGGFVTWRIGDPSDPFASVTSTHAHCSQGGGLYGAVSVTRGSAWLPPVQ
ncbi:MAG: alpha-2-macroglobulin family protein [Acidimicrobiales bacterium]